MREHPSLRLVFLLGAISLALVACPAQDQEGAPAQDQEGAPADDDAAVGQPTEEPGGDQGEVQRGGTLVVAHSSDPTSVNPYRFGATIDRNVITNIYDTLVEFDRESYEIVPSLAQEWETSDDGLVWTFHLRDGVEFHDGSPLTADDVVTSMERAMEEAAGRTAPLLQRVESVDAVDDQTVEITLGQPDRILLSTLVDVYISPAEVAFDDLSEHPVGTGPFQFVEWARNQQVRLERSENYWQEGLPYLDGIDFVTIPDPSVATLRLRRGDIDVLFATPLGEVGTLQAAGTQMLLPPEGFNTGFYHFHANTRREPWSDPLLRQAASKALDRAALAQSLFGFMQVVSNPVEMSEAFFNPDAPSYNEQDVEGAQALLEEAGHPDGVDGGELIVCGLGFEFEILAQVVQSQLAAVGIEVDVNVLELGGYVERTLGDNVGDFDLALCRLVPKPDEYDLINHPFAKLFIETQGWIDQRPEFFELLDSARSTPDDAEYRDAIMELQTMAMEGLPDIILGGATNPIAADPSVEGFIAHMQGHMFLHDTWISE